VSIFCPPDVPTCGSHACIGRGGGSGCPPSLPEWMGMICLVRSRPGLYVGPQLCVAHGVNVRGIVLNKVKKEKYDMVLHYSQKAFARWGIPLVACVPNHDTLDRSASQRARPS
jgi:hypothetical protein